jgi:hypothetical protein
MGFDSILEAGGQVAEAEAGARSLEFDAQLNDQNATLQRQQTMEDERKFRLLFNADQGSNRAAIGASGVQLGGSALDALQSNARQSEFDALQIRHQGEVNAIAFENEAILNRSGAQSTRTLGFLRATTTLVKGAQKSAAMAAGGGAG